MSWIRVTKSEPCEICGRADWCGVSSDGCMAVCMRVESDKLARNGGWLHKLRDDERSQSRTRRVRVPMKSEPTLDFDQLTEQYQQSASDDAIEQLAIELSVSPDSLRRLTVGWDGEAFAFPMRNAKGCVVGIRRRLPDGRKLSVKGGHEGLFIPDGLADDSTIIICEGPTDTAAILTLGLEAIGRPSCRGGASLLEAFCRGRRVVILADGDSPGRAGAWVLATALKLVCIDVRVIHPPSEIKDARAWLQAGGTRSDVQRAIDSAEPVRVKVRCV